MGVAGDSVCRRFSLLDLKNRLSLRGGGSRGRFIDLIPTESSLYRNFTFFYKKVSKIQKISFGYFIQVNL